MPKLTNVERRKLKDLILTAEIRGYIGKGLHDCVRTNLGIDIGDRHINDILYSMKKESARWLYAMKTKDDYIHEFKVRVAEIETQKQGAWQDYLSTTPSEIDLRNKLRDELHRYTVTLTNLYLLLPQLGGSPSVIKDKQSIQDTAEQTTIPQVE